MMGVAEEAVEDVNEPRLTVSGAARRLGIAPATLRTWDRRYGVGPSDHAQGRHRRYTTADMARLEAMQQALVKGASPAEAARYAQAADLPLRARAAPRPADAAPSAPRPVPGPRPRWPDPAAGIDVIASLGRPGPQHRDAAPLVVGAARGGGGLRMPGAGTAARGLARAALALDSAAVRRIVEESIARDGLAVAWDEVVRPALDAVQVRVRVTGRGVEVARLLEGAVIAVCHVRAHAAPVALPTRPVLLAGMPGDQDGVPLAVLAALLAERCIAVRPLGPALPADALGAAVRRVAPAAVVLWSHDAATADAEVVAALPVTRPRFRIFAAGPGWAGVVLPRTVIRMATPTDAVGGIADTVLR